MWRRRSSAGRESLTRSETRKPHAPRAAQVFREIDVDGSGSISKQEFRRAVKKLKVAATDKTVTALFDFIDEDGSGEIDIEEWRVYRVRDHI